MKILEVLSAIFVIVGFTALLMLAKAEIQSSPLKQFNITPEILRLNWTNDYSGNITLKSNATNQSWVLIQVLNDTSGLSENYTQSNSLTDCQSGNLKLMVRNTTHATGNYQNVSNGTNVDVRVVNTNFLCKPGRYSTATFTLRNVTQTNETANATIYLDAPIATFNTLTASTGIGSFGGSMSVNATEYHSYFFDTSNITNATSVVINMSGWSSSQDIDVFLFDNSSSPLLQSKSINKTSSNEYLIFNYLPSTAKMWEIRVYGNSTSAISYNANILFSGLNATNSSNANQQFGLIDLGIKNASTVTNFNITLRNEANLTHTVVEEKEIYYVKRFGGIGANNFSVIIPDSSIVRKVSVSLNWTGGSNYSFNLINTTGNIVLISPLNGSYRLANVTGANQELWNETTSADSVAGAWRLQILNNTNDTVTYNATVFAYVTASSWLSSNFSSMTFNRTGNLNFTRDATINLTVPNNSIDGFYEGSIRYVDGNRAGISVPFKINVTAPVVAVNGTLNSKIITIDEDIDANITRTLFFEVNNSGSIDAVTTFLNSSDKLSCLSGSCSGYNGSLSFNSTSLLSKQSSQLIRVQVGFNSSMPTGVYEGWVYINATNDTVALSSHPYNSFNITVRLNLTSNISVEMLEIKSLLGSIVTRNSSAENVTVRFRLNYINSTEIEAQNTLNTSNLSLWLVGRNVSSFRVPTTGNLTLFNGTNPLYNGGDYEVNATIPADTVGGFYEFHLAATYTKSTTYTGEGTNLTFLVNNTGLLMSSNVSGCSFDSSCSTSLSVSNSSTTTVYVNASNFGNIPASSVTLTYSESCDGYSLSNPSATSACSAGTLSGSTATISPAANTTACIVSWVITANSSANSACTGRISGSSNVWYNPNGINISITVTASGSSSSSSTSGSGAASPIATTSTTLTSSPPVYLEFSSYPAIVSVEQANNTTVNITVKNINNTVGQTLTLTVEDINASWYSINPSTEVKIAPTNTTTYTVKFIVPNGTQIKDYPGKLKATSNYTNLTQNFVLKVTPGQELKGDIDKDIDDWETKITNLEKEINTSKSKKLNVSDIEVKFADLKNKFVQVKSLKQNGDYRGAFDLLKELDSLFDDTSTLLQQAKQANKPSLWSYLKWGLVVLAIIGVSVIAFLFWPQGGYNPNKGYTPQPKEKEDLKKKIEDNYEKLKEKWKDIKNEDK